MRQQCSSLAGLFLSATTALAQIPTLHSSDEGRWIKNVRQLTSRDMGLTKAGEAYFSPDGKNICFQAFPAGKDEYQIYVMALDGAAPRMISTGQGATTCAYFHPDGQRVLFASNHRDPRAVDLPADFARNVGGRNYLWSFFPGMDVYEYSLASGELKALIEAPGYDAEASYSPDGRQLIFTSMRDGDQEIYLCDADGKNARRITNAPGYDGGPFFSPDGRRIVYRSDRKGDGNLQIFVNSVSGDAERALTRGDVLHWCPFWHPSGKWLIYTRADHSSGPPNYDLFLLGVDQPKEIRITDDRAFDGLPVFSPDGRKLLWTSKRGGLDEAQVFIADFLGLTPDGSLGAESLP